MKRRLETEDNDSNSPLAKRRSLTHHNMDDDDEQDLNLSFNQGDETQLELDDEENAQQIVRKMAENSDRIESKNGISEAGVIESIILQDFMCHKMLKVNLGPNLNFIIGHNGSGKSAILTALTVCLGSTASQTSRAKKHEHFIRGGANSAKITVKIKNKGPDSYKNDIYGDCIYVVRIIKKELSSYKILSSRETVISTKREELNAICDHFMIQMNNPLVVLNQDKAKTFLSGTHADEKYNFFMEGTGLQQLAQDYEIVRQSIAKDEEEIQKKQGHLSDLHKKLKEIEVRIRGMEEGVELQDKAEKLKKEMAWAQIVEMEMNLEKLNAQKSAICKRIEEEGKKSTPLRNKLQEYEEMLQQAKDKIMEKRESATPLKEKLEEFKRQNAETQSQIDNLCMEKRSISEAATNYHNRLLSLTSKIKEEAERRDADQRQERERKRIAVQKCESELEELYVQSTEVKTQVADMERRRNEKSESIKNAELMKAKAENEVSRYQNHIDQMQQQAADRLKAFGRSMPQILRDIKAEVGWSTPPTGPFGMYVKIKYPEWSRILETLVGNALGAFVVDNHQDRNRLNLILSKYQCHSPIYIGKHDQFDYTKGEPSSEFLTVLRALKIDNEIVLRQMINNLRIEQIILVKERRDADEIMAEFPRNVLACYTLKGFSVGNKGGGRASMALNLYRGAPRMVDDVSKLLQETEQKLRHAQDTYSTINSDLNLMKQELNDEIRRGENLLAEDRRLERNIFYKKENLKSLKEDLEEDESINNGAYKSEFESISRQREVMLRQLVELEENIQKKDSLKNGLKDKMISISENMKDLQQEIDQLKEEASAILEKKIRINSNIERAMKRLETIESDRIRLQASIDAATRELKVGIEQAQQICPQRIQTERKPNEIDRILKDTLIKFREYEKHQGTLEEHQENYEQTKIDYEKGKSDLSGLLNFVNKLKVSLDNRLTKWREFRRYIALRTKISFTHCLNQRGFSGSMNFDHRGMKLTLQVQVSEEASIESNPSSLSGGEKSFSTISFILALWEAMSCPIRCLDEFDVFMDAVNRRESMNMILQNSRIFKKHQYILISPQEMAGIESGPDIRVNRLRDPERGQMTLEESFR